MKHVAFSPVALSEEEKRVVEALLTLKDKVTLEDLQRHGILRRRARDLLRKDLYKEIGVRQ